MYIQKNLIAMPTVNYHAHQITQVKAHVFPSKTQKQLSTCDKITSETLPDKMTQVSGFGVTAGLPTTPMSPEPRQRREIVTSLSNRGIIAT